MNDGIHNAVEEAIHNAVSAQLSDIKFNLVGVLGGLLYSMKLELEKQGGVCDLDDLVRIVVDTTHREGPDDESWPAYDEEAVKDIVGRLEKVLQAHGIEQAWNIGERESGCRMNEIMAKLIGGEKVTDLDIENSLYEVCDDVHAGCSEACPVFKANHGLVDDHGGGCACFKNGKKMLAFLREAH